MTSLVIVGASLAGLRAAEEARLNGFEGRLVIVSDEMHQPYDRPPLSKSFLAGDDSDSVIELPSLMPDGWEGLDAVWLRGTPAVKLHHARRAVELADGHLVEYDALLISTGATPVVPGWAAGPGVFAVRTLADSLALRAALTSAKSVAVLGAGFIGTEVAAACRTRGVQVTLIDAELAPLVRVLGHQVGAALGDIHRRRGVALSMGSPVLNVERGANGQPTAVALQGGDSVEADVIVLGLGVRPNTAWLEDSGLALDDGVLCDSTCAANEGVAAAGDVARWTHAELRTRIRVEHWDNAQSMGPHAARTLMAHLAGDVGEPYVPTPWFWSDQYEHRLQLAGHIPPGAAFELREGTLERPPWFGVYMLGDREVAACSLDMPVPVLRWQRALARLRD